MCCFCPKLSCKIIPEQTYIASLIQLVKTYCRPVSEGRPPSQRQRRRRRVPHSTPRTAPRRGRSSVGRRPSAPTRWREFCWTVLCPPTSRRIWASPGSGLKPMSILILIGTGTDFLNFDVAPLRLYGRGQRGKSFYVEALNKLTNRENRIFSDTEKRILYNGMRQYQVTD